MTDEVSQPIVMVVPDGAVIEHIPDGARPGPKLSIWRTIAAMVPGSVASMNIGLQPILFGALVEAGRITPAQLGQIATLEILAIAIGATVTPRLFRFGGVRIGVFLMAIALALVNLATFWAHSAPPIYVLKTVSGLLAGGLMGATVYLITHTAQPERSNAVFTAISTVPQMVGNYLLAVLLNPVFGPYAGFGLMAVLALFASTSASVLRRPPTASAPSQIRSRTLGICVSLTLLAVVVENAGIGAVWDYLDQVARLNGLSHQVSGMAVSGLLGFQLLGAMSVAWIGWRIDYRLMLLACPAFLSLNAIEIYWQQGAVGYVTAACVFGYVQILLYPYGIKLLVDLDRSRQAAMLLTPLSYLGTALGPFLCSWFVKPGDVSAAYWIALAAMLLTAGVYGAVFVLARRTPRTPSFSAIGA